MAVCLAWFRKCTIAILNVVSSACGRFSSSCATEVLFRPYNASGKILFKSSVALSSSRARGLENIEEANDCMNESSLISSRILLLPVELREVDGRVRSGDEISTSSHRGRRNVTDTLMVSAYGLHTNPDALSMVELVTWPKPMRMLGQSGW